jgi:hypothetical protein
MALGEPEFSRQFIRNLPAPCVGPFARLAALDRRGEGHVPETKELKQTAQGHGPARNAGINVLPTGTWPPQPRAMKSFGDKGRRTRQHSGALWHADTRAEGFDFTV